MDFMSQYNYGRYRKSEPERYTLNNKYLGGYICYCGERDVPTQSDQENILI